MYKALKEFGAGRIELKEIFDRGSILYIEFIKDNKNRAAIIESLKDFTNLGVDATTRVIEFKKEIIPGEKYYELW